MSNPTPFQKAMQNVPMNEIPGWGYETPGLASDHGSSAVQVSFTYTADKNGLDVVMKADQGGQKSSASGTLEYDLSKINPVVTQVAAGNLTVTDSSSPDGRSVPFMLELVQAHADHPTVIIISNSRDYPLFSSFYSPLDNGSFRYNLMEKGHVLLNVAFPSE